MSNIKRFFECLVPVTACNLKCHYCYIMQRGGRNMEITKLKYSVDTIRKALRQERLGGGMLLFAVWCRRDSAW